MILSAAGAAVACSSVAAADTTPMYDHAEVLKNRLVQSSDVNSNAATRFVKQQREVNNIGDRAVRGGGGGGGGGDILENAEAFALDCVNGNSLAGTTVGAIDDIRTGISGFAAPCTANLPTGAPDRWYTTTVASDVAVFVTNCTGTLTTYDSRLMVFAEDPASTGLIINVCCGEDVCQGGITAPNQPFVAEIPCCALSGATSTAYGERGVYYFVQDGWSSTDSGAFTMDITCLTAPPSPECPGPPPPPPVPPVDCQVGDVVAPQTCSRQADADDGCFATTDMQAFVPGTNNFVGYVVGTSDPAGSAPEWIAINCGDTQCGATYVSPATGGNEGADNDYYELATIATADLLVSFESEDIATTTIGYIDAAAIGGAYNTNGCTTSLDGITNSDTLPDGLQFLNQLLDTPPGVGSIQFQVTGAPAGLHWFLVGPNFATAVNDCAAGGASQDYRLTVECVTQCVLPGDINGSGSVNIQDLNLVLGNFGTVCNP